MQAAAGEERQACPPPRHSKACLPATHATEPHSLRASNTGNALDGNEQESTKALAWTGYGPFPNQEVILTYKAESPLTARRKS